jgi:hypothetical protein
VGFGLSAVEPLSNVEGFRTFKLRLLKYVEGYEKGAFPLAKFN